MFISSKEATIIAVKLGAKPTTQQGMVGTGFKYGFAIKKEGHWLINKTKLLQFFNVQKNTPFVLAKKLGVNSGSLAYTILKLNIKVKTFEHRKYIGENDAKKIKRYYTEKIKRNNKKHHRKNTK